jgi:hypothetical protein
MKPDQLTRLLQHPDGHELAIGFELLRRRQVGNLPTGYASVRQYVRAVSARDYSTVMRWVRIADSLQDPADPRAEWGLHRLGELLRIEDPARREVFIAEQEPGGGVGRRPVRELRAEVSHFLGRQAPAPTVTAPHEVTAAAVRRAVRRAGLDPTAAGLRLTRGRRADGPGAVTLTVQVGEPVAAQALTVAGGVLEELTRARSAWRKAPVPTQAPASMSLSLRAIDALGPRPVQVRWASRDLVEVVKAGTVIARLPVGRETIGRILKAEGNRKTAGVTPILGSIRLGCLRRATGFARCDQPCYDTPPDSRGCFSNLNEHAIHQDSQAQDFDVIHNGLVNGLLSIRLPVTGSASLDRYTRRREFRQAAALRVDAESADGAMSIGLGILQVWAENNPRLRFTTICSHAVWPSNAMLDWLASLPNVWVGHTVSAWFGPDELDHRFACLDRYLDFGIPSAVWISTSPRWENGPVVQRALQRVPPAAIIEYPLKGDHRQEFPVLHVNGLGACGDHRVDHAGHPFVVAWRPTPDGAGLRSRLERVGHEYPAVEPLHARCQGCQLRCGVAVLEAAVGQSATSTPTD